MTSTETDLLVVLFALYIYECVYWIAPTEQVFTRSGRGWTMHAVARVGFTLLGRMPVVASPLLLNPGFLRLPTQPESTQQEPAPHTLQRALRYTAARLDSLWLLRLQCQVQALLLLVELPLLLWTHRLTLLWPEYTGLLALNHTLLLVSAIRELRRIPNAAWATPALQLAFNPLGAVRSLDLIANLRFQAALAPRLPKPAKE